MAYVRFQTLVLCIPLAANVAMVSVAECKRGPHSDSSLPLQATLDMQPGFNGDCKLESLNFCLENTSDESLQSSPESWELFIDGKEAPDPGGQLWMGGQPSGGYGTVSPGQTFHFGKALPIAIYFPDPRMYKVYWHAANFRSNTVEVRGGPKLTCASGQSVGVKTAGHAPSK